MTKNLTIKTLAFAVATAAMGSAALAGQTAPVTMPVSATVVQSCVLNTVSGVSFGTYIPGTESDAVGSFTVGCTSPSTTLISVTISGGNGAGHSQGTDHRAMVSGNNFLSYDLFQDAGHTTAWPAGTPLPVANDTVIPPNLLTISVYGRISSNLTGIVNGTYSDTVSITASF
jgi:spore coat protein U-like protein